MSATLLWACNLTNDGDALGDGVARSTLTKGVAFFFLVYGVVPHGLVFAHLSAW